jgi:hypothetical protein
MTKKKSSRTPPKQERVPGTELKKDKKLSDAAAVYVDKRDQRMAWTEEESDAKEELIKLMQERDLDYYADDTFEVRLKHTDTTVKVKRRKTEVDAEAAE